MAPSILSRSPAPGLAMRGDIPASEYLPMKPALSSIPHSPFSANLPSCKGPSIKQASKCGKAPAMLMEKKRRWQGGRGQLRKTSLSALRGRAHSDPMPTCRQTAQWLRASSPIPVRTALVPLGRHYARSDRQGRFRLFAIWHGHLPGSPNLACGYLLGMRVVGPDRFELSTYGLTIRRFNTFRSLYV